MAWAGVFLPGHAWAGGSLENGASTQALAGQARPAHRTLARKASKHSADSDTDSDSPGAAAGAQARKAGDDSAAKADKSAKESGAKSGGSLDSLMSDVVSEEKTTATAKGKKRDSKEMDALLKDVQKKNDAAPVVKKEEPAAAPSLSPGEISAAMGQLKGRGNACAQRLGRGGTAELKITVSKDGRVTDVKLAGKLAGTPVGTCIEQAAHGLSFRPNAGLRFDYKIDVH